MQDVRAYELFCRLRGVHESYTCYVYYIYIRFKQIADVWTTNSNGKRDYKMWRYYVVFIQLTN